MPQPVEACMGSPDAQMQQQQQFMWHAQRPSTGAPMSPRTSKSQIEETPSTPLNRVMRSIASPAVTSPKGSWLRTPSPDHGYSMNQFRPAHQQVITSQVPPPTIVSESADPWAGSTLMVITQNYYGESDGYLNVAIGTQVRAMIDSP